MRPARTYAVASVPSIGTRSDGARLSSRAYGSSSSTLSRSWRTSSIA
jgi:hypothetical protein